MKKLVYKKIDERIEQVVVHHSETVDENGNVIEAYDETIEKVVPVMGVVYEEMTQEEIDELSKQDEVVTEPTYEERLEAMENAVLEMIMGGAF